jgi:hypothetical protein
MDPLKSLVSRVCDRVDYLCRKFHLFPGDILYRWIPTFDKGCLYRFRVICSLLPARFEHVCPRWSLHSLSVQHEIIFCLCVILYFWTSPLIFVRSTSSSKSVRRALQLAWLVDRSQSLHSEGVLDGSRERSKSHNTRKLREKALDNWKKTLDGVCTPENQEVTITRSDSHEIYFGPSSRVHSNW